MVFDFPGDVVEAVYSRGEIGLSRSFLAPIQRLFVPLGSWLKVCS